MVFTLSHLQEKTIEQRRPLFMFFVDFRKAFDTVNRDTLWNVLMRFGCPDVFVDILRQFNDGMEATVVAGGGETPSFSMRNGVRQGCVLAPALFALFSLFLAAVLLTAGFEAVQGVPLVRTKVRRVNVRDLLYADDAVLVAVSLDGQ